MFAGSLLWVHGSVMVHEDDAPGARPGGPEGSNGCGWKDGTTGW
jgi:hypothetical protein